MFQEQYARADAYALVAQLFSGAPDSAFLRLYSKSPDAHPATDSRLQFTLQEAEPTGYEAALRRFQVACALHDHAAISAEYDELFNTRGGAIVAAGPVASAPQLAALREHLAARGLAAAQSELAVASYVSGTCEVMRWLVEHDEEVGLQIRFFDEFVFAGVNAVCDALAVCTAAAFYRAVADLAENFIAAEKAAVDLQRAA
jgi:TorA maturation chaperone TorD